MSSYHYDIGQHILFIYTSEILNKQGTKVSGPAFSEQVPSSDTLRDWTLSPTTLSTPAQMENSLYYNLNTWQPINQPLHNYKAVGINP